MTMKVHCPRLNRRLLTVPVRTAQGLLCWLALLGAASLAAAPPELNQAAEHCLTAQTPAQCQSALPACEQVLAGSAQIASARHDDAFISDVLSRTARCEDELGRYAAAE